MSETETHAPMASVPTEAEMSSFRNIFEKVINTVVDASRLSAQFAELSSQVDGLKRDLEEYRDRNRWLNKELDEVRQARDSYRQQLAQTQTELQGAIGDCEMLRGQVSSLNDKLQHRIDELDRVRRESDDWQLKAMDWEDKFSVLNTKFTDLKDLAKDAFGLEEPQPSPPLPVTQPVQEPFVQAERVDIDWPEEIPQKPTRIYHDHWVTGSLWDNVERRYYTE